MRNLKIAGLLVSVSTCLAVAAAAAPVNRGVTARTMAANPDTQIVQVFKRERAFKAYLTGYSYWDNTPRGSAAIARPVIHSKAGGKGTYRDPITIAVGYRLAGGSARLDYPPGTRFYLPSIQRYAIVEDICGDGPRPHLTGCKRGHRGLPWLDIYVDGRRAGAKAANACMRRITGVQTFIINPRKTYPVTIGALTETGCGFGDS